MTGPVHVGVGSAYFFSLGFGAGEGIVCLQVEIFV